MANECLNNDFLFDTSFEDQLFKKDQEIKFLKKLLEDKTRYIDYLEEIIAIMPGHVYWLDENNVFLGCNNLQAQNAKLESRSDIVGKKNRDMPWKAQAEELDQFNLEVMKTCKPHVVEEVAEMANGIGIYLSHKVPLFDKSNEVVGLVGISLDITERKRMEQELVEAKEKAEAANIAKSDFLAAVNHELRTPLTGILGMARLLASEPLDPIHAQQVNDIITAGQHLLPLINDLLDLAKLEAGKFELHINPLDLRKLAEEVATVLQPVAKTKKLELRINFAEGTPHLIMSDSKALRQVLINLVGNALKFTHEGYIEIKAECLDKNLEEAVLKISVNDSGIGIPKEKIQSVFDKFNQADNSRTRKYGGTGLGLTISKAFVELLGGKIQAESTEGVGSSFYFVIKFPLQSESSLTSSWEPYKSSVRILIVDETTRGEVIRRHIGSSLVEVVPGNEAFNYLLTAYQNKQHFDVVMIDHELKTIPFNILARQINQQHVMAKPLLICMIPEASVALYEEAKQSGFFDCVIKPAHPTELLSTLTSAWEKWQERFRTRHAIIPLNPDKKFKVLLVEDDPIVQKVHKMMLSKVGCEIDVANSGEEALAMFGNGYDMIFMDVGLGSHISGMDVTREIRKRENGVHIPIIAMTGYGDEDSKAGCFAAGMNDIAVKPTTPEHLKSLLQQWVIK